MDKVFLYITIFGCVFFTGLGVISKDIDNSEYLPYYIIFLLCTIGIVIYSIGKRKSVTNIKVSKIIENNKKLFNLLGVIALILQFSILIYPEFKLMNLFRFGGYTFDTNYFNNRLVLQTDIINRILGALRTATKPFLFIWLYNIRDKKVKIIFIYLLYEYIGYVNNYYIGRSSLISIGIFVWIYLYEEKVFSRRILRNLLIAIVIGFILMSATLANVRIKRETKFSLGNIGEAMNSIIMQETSTQQYLDVCNSASKDLSFGKMLLSILEAPLMFLPDIDFPVLSYEFTERLLGLEYGDKDYYIMLPCAYGEGVMIFGKQLSWLYGLFIGGVISYIYVTLRRVPQFKLWLIFILMEYAKSFRGGIQTFVTYIWNSSFFLVLLLIFLQIARRKRVNNGIIKEDTKK